MTYNTPLNLCYLNDLTYNSVEPLRLKQPELKLYNFLEPVTVKRPEL